MKKGIRFGIDLRHDLTGADLYVRIFQIVSILPIPYIFTATAYSSIMKSSNILSCLFDLGMSALPRIWVLLLSWVYRLTSSEVVVYFALLAAALILGMICNRVFIGSPEKSIKLHKAFIVLIAIDLVIRLIPLNFNSSFGSLMAVLGFAIRAACLALVALDLRAQKR